ncbi:RNA-binding S4 domain-containing protein [Streptomyces nodosus]|uniref:RNA-binding S4 domain-containing protein n=1 Tax=Streptomyces nodosus TaxID=40318 RepID=UPI003451DD59
MASAVGNGGRTGGTGQESAAGGKRAEDRWESVTAGEHRAAGEGEAVGSPGSGDPKPTGEKPSDAKTAAALAAAEAAGPSAGESVRIDSWIWSVRLVKTRSMGATACRGGHVRVNGERVKPAYAVRVGDEVRLRHEGRERIVVVKRLIRKRVGAPVAVQCYVDNSPPPPPRDAVAPAGIRDRGAGRPTKRDRREMERLRSPGAAPGGGFGDGHGAQGPSGSRRGSGTRGRPGGRGGSGKH